MSKEAAVGESSRLESAIADTCDQIVDCGELSGGAVSSEGCEWKLVEIVEMAGLLGCW
jgi:hypothetical protein